MEKQSWFCRVTIEFAAGEADWKLGDGSWQDEADAADRALERFECMMKTAMESFPGGAWCFEPVPNHVDSTKLIGRRQS